MKIKKIFKNYTKNFTKSISQTGNLVYYVWNEKAVVNEIIENKKSWNKTNDELIQKYYDWFKIFAANHNIKIYWDDNSKFTKSARELASKNNVRLIDGSDLEQFKKIV